MAERGTYVASSGGDSWVSLTGAPSVVTKRFNDVRGWWSGDIEGATDKLGAEFTYRYKDMHRSKQRITALIPGKKVAWHVVESHLAFVEDKSEWNGTDIVFEISETKGKTEVRFAHIGLVPEDECYDSCSNAWSSLIHGNLRRLIMTGKSQSDVLA